MKNAINQSTIFGGKRKLVTIISIVGEPVQEGADPAGADPHTRLPRPRAVLGGEVAAVRHLREVQPRRGHQGSHQGKS